MKKENYTLNDNERLKNDMHMIIHKINQYYLAIEINISDYHRFHEKDFYYLKGKLNLNVKTKAKLAAIELNKYLGE